MPALPATGAPRLKLAAVLGVAAAIATQDIEDAHAR